MIKKIDLLCTLGPSSLNEKIIGRLDDCGVSIFRINLSHTDIDKIEPTIKFIKKYTDKPICIDTEGAQIRTGSIDNNRIYLEEDSTIEVTSKKTRGNNKIISLVPISAISQIKPGDILSVDFDSVLLQIIESNKYSLRARVISGGFVKSNKGVTIDRRIELPPISSKDKKAIRIARKHGIRYFALSFANNKKSVEEFRRHIGKESYIISKIESREGVENIDGICRVTDALLIDRGDLSKEEASDKIPFIQKLIIKKANSRKIPIYVATNLLESMVQSKKPTRAETNDIINTLMDGADGLVLAAETAIGAYPVNCAMMIKRLIKNFTEFLGGHSLKDLSRKDSFLLIEPHGGVLVNRTKNNFNLSEIKRYKKLLVDKTVLLDTEQIAVGAFSPLEGFMTKKELDAVLRNYRLPNRIIWPMPVILQVDNCQTKNLKEGDNVALALEDTGEVYAILTIDEIYTYDLNRIKIEMFGTRNDSHPGMRLLRRGGNYFIGGKIDLIKRLPSVYKYYELTPMQTRAVFENRGWGRVVGFHTRNVSHRVHEYIQLRALEKYHCDGLFIHPAVGPKKEGDYHAGIILKSYELMIRKYFPKGKVVLGAFQNYSRYAGPREAVFTALCRKNFGCSHFIVGRDHAGVGNYYGSSKAYSLFKHLGNIGIIPIFFNEFNFCKKCNQYVDSCKHDRKYIMQISGTQGREMLKAGRYPPQWFMRKDISGLILNELKKRGGVFVR